MLAKLFVVRCSLFVALATALLFSGCGGSTGSSGKNAPTVIRIGNQWIPEYDPNAMDPVTGVYAMDPQERVARLYAEQQVLEKLNVKIQWVQYGDLPLELLRTVMAGDPLADMVRIIVAWEGTLLAENVLQPLDEWADLFQDEDTSWMLTGKVYGNYYFLNNILRHGPFQPLVYNIGMLNQVPALKENGKTVLPADLFLEGKWTWSVFEDYLQKISDHWARGGTGGTDVFAYGADLPVAALMAMHSNGASAYGDNGLEIDSPQTKEAVAYIERLMARNLIRTGDYVSEDTERSEKVRGITDQVRFMDGYSVFANVWTMWAPQMAKSFNDRGDTIGVVPFPRPDRMEPDDPNYRHFNEAMDSFAIPRGVSREKAELAVKAFREYNIAYYTHISGSDRPLDYLQSDQPLRFSAMQMQLDTTNEDYGDKILEIWKFLGSAVNSKTNDYIRLVGIWDLWRNEILSDSLLQRNGASSYAVQVDSKMPVVSEVVNRIQGALNSTGIVDFEPPRFNDRGVRVAFPAGTNPEEIDWNNFMFVTDNADGGVDVSSVSADLSGIDFSKPGFYENAAIFTVTDNAGNEGRWERTVVVYDGENTVPPVLVIRNGYRALEVNENASAVNWREDFVASATDKDGLDVRDSIFADLSELNTTIAGSYAVKLFAVDFAGNETSAEITVTVE